jgi:hypothetical protein
MRSEAPRYQQLFPDFFQELFPGCRARTFPQVNRAGSVSAKMMVRVAG